MRAGINRAEGVQSTTVGANDLILVQHISSGQPVPRLVKYSNFITGGGTGLTVNTVPFVNSSGDFTQDNTNFNYVASTHTLTAKNISVGASGLAGSLALFSGTSSKGSWLFTPVDNTGNTVMTITNAAQAGAYTYTIPSAGASASFMMTQGAQTVVGNNLFSGTTQINTLNVGISGTAGVINLFSGTGSKGSWQFLPVDNTGNTVMTITNAAQAGAYTYTIPSAGASASFMMTQGAQTIVGNNTFSGTTQANTLNVGVSGTAGTLTIFPATPANGTFVLQALNNASNFAATLTNAAVGQATVYTLPDPGAATANIILSAGTQTIGGVKTFSSIPIGTAQAIQVYLSPITAQAGAVSVLFQAPFAGTVTSVAAAISGAIGATDLVITPSVYHSGTPTAITGGAVTVATAGSGIASHATVTPSAANTFVSGDTITATVTGGTGTVNGVITLYVTRTA